MHPGPEDTILAASFTSASFTSGEGAIHGDRIHLQVLGPVTVHSPDVHGPATLVTQALPLAVLCYLALARPRGLQSRDALIARLWPERDAVRGRRALRNALYTLRQALGPDVIVTVGEGLLGIDPARLTCDAHVLERERIMATEVMRTAVPFDGLYVQGAPRFEEWLSLERDRLRGLLTRAVRKIAVPSRTRRRCRRRDVPHARRRRDHHAQDAWVLCVRGHHLFLRNTPGNAPEELRQSRGCFERALSIDPTCASAHAGLANYYAVTARRGAHAVFHETFAQAIAYSERALALDPSLAAPHVHFAVKAMYLDDDWDRAGVEFACAVRHEPEYAEGRRFYGVWLGMSGRKEDALAQMEEAARLEPDIAYILSSLGAARLAVGDDVGGEAALRATLAINGRHLPARERLVSVLEENGRIGEALQERLRPPTMAGAEALHAAFVAEGADGYTTQLRAMLQERIRALETRLVEARRLRSTTSSRLPRCSSSACICGWAITAGPRLAVAECGAASGAGAVVFRVPGPGVSADARPESVRACTKPYRRGGVTPPAVRSGACGSHP